MSGRRRLQSGTSLCRKSLVMTLGAAPHSPSISGVQKQASQETPSAGTARPRQHLHPPELVPHGQRPSSHFHLSGRHRQSAPRPAPVDQRRASVGHTFCCISIRGCPISHSGWACDPGLAGQSLPLLTIARVQLESTSGHLMLGCDAGCPMHQRRSWLENKAILGGTKVPSS